MEDERSLAIMPPGGRTEMGNDIACPPSGRYAACRVTARSEVDSSRVWGIELRRFPVLPSTAESSPPLLQSKKPPLLLAADGQETSRAIRPAHPSASSFSTTRYRTSSVQPH